MLEGLDAIPWEDLKHAYGSASDVPDLLRQLLDRDPKKRSQVISKLYGNVFHQGTRYQATPYVVPFLIEMCASPSVYDRFDILELWGSLITGYFSLQERPYWGDGENIYWCGELDEYATEHGSHQELHEIYRESLKGEELLGDLLNDADFTIRAGAVRVLACMPTIAESSIPKLKARFNQEVSQWVRAGIAFALGELGAVETLQQILAEEQFTATKCMTACQLARIAPEDSLIEPLLEFVSQPINDYERILGAGGKSTGDAAFAISHLPRHIQQQAIPAICQLLKQTRSFDTMPLVKTLLSAAFERRKEPLTELTEIQKLVLSQMLMTDELWSIGNLIGVFGAYGLPDGLGNKKEECAKLVGIELTTDRALTELRWGLIWAEMDGFLEKARSSIDRALEMDSSVFKRTPAPAEAWFLYAKAFAEIDKERSLLAFRQAYLINPAIANQISPSWYLADLLQEYDF